MAERGLARAIWTTAGALALVTLALFALQALRSWHSIAAWRSELSSLPMAEQAFGNCEQMAIELSRAEGDRRAAELSSQAGDLQRFRGDTARLSTLFQSSRSDAALASSLPMLLKFRSVVSQGLRVLQQPLIPVRSRRASEAPLNSSQPASADLDQQMSAALAEERGELDSELARARRLGRDAFVSASLAVGLLLGSALLALATALHARRRAVQLSSMWSECERRWALLASDAVDYALLTLDPSGRVREWGLGAERLHGYTAQEIQGRQWWPLYPDADRAAGLPQLVLERAAQHGRDDSEGWRLRKNASRFYAGVAVHALRDERRRLQGFAVVERDLTEVVQRREALEHTQEALRQSQKMEALGQLSGGIAHDFKNVLHVIENCVHILQRRLSADRAHAAPYLEMIERNAEHASSLTQRLLSYARRAPLHREPVEANQLVNEVAELLRHTFNEAIEIKLELTEATAMIEVDSNQFDAALLNLAVNARDAMPSGGRLTIATAPFALEEQAEALAAEMRAGQYVMVEVSDTGIGMDEATQRRALEPFFTTKGQRNAIGLGLLQVRGFVEQSGGYLRIDSAPEQGTSVQLYLPRMLHAGALLNLRQQSALHG